MEDEKMSMINVTIPNWLDLICACPLLVFRLLRFGYTFRRIYLGEGQWTILDHDDYYRLKDFKWVAYAGGRGGENLYAVRFKLVSPKKTTFVSMHREIMNANDERVVDHKNCNSLDNRKNNLRLATRAENIRNRRKQKNTSSQFIGVSFSKSQGRWASEIKCNGKKIWLGRFDNEIDAARAYDEAAKKYFGEFARLNFPEQNETQGFMRLLEFFRFG
jgi:hypothetical protein